MWNLIRAEAVLSAVIADAFAFLGYGVQTSAALSTTAPLSPSFSLRSNNLAHPPIRERRCSAARRTIAAATSCVRRRIPARPNCIWAQRARALGGRLVASRGASALAPHRGMAFLLPYSAQALGHRVTSAGACHASDGLAVPSSSRRH